MLYSCISLILVATTEKQTKMPRRATLCKHTEDKEMELNMEEKEATPVEEVETILPLAEPNRTTEETKFDSIMKFLQESEKRERKTGKHENKITKN